MNLERCKELLSLGSEYSYNDIIKSYRNLCKVHHPDVGGCADKFSEITSAKNILTEALESSDLCNKPESSTCSLCSGSKITLKFCTDCGGKGSIVKIAKHNGIPKREKSSCARCHSTGKEFRGCLVCNKNEHLSREDIENYILRFKY